LLLNLKKLTHAEVLKRAMADECDLYLEDLNMKGVGNALRRISADDLELTEEEA